MKDMGANPLPPASITSTSSTSPPIDRSGAPAAASVAAQTDSGSSSQGPSGASTDVEMQRLPRRSKGVPRRGRWRSWKWSGMGWFSNTG
ncbi:hypothetical protein NXS19_003338 [Fusarium pseudograminearum]|nr:hypothetical protein NXS19_003338 [Fusarium pseudograminearum]